MSEDLGPRVRAAFEAELRRQAADPGFVAVTARQVRSGAVGSERGRRAPMLVAAAITVLVIVVLQFMAITRGGHPSGTSAGASASRAATPAPAPPPGRADGAATYDSDRHLLVVFGGVQGGSPLNDTWTWDGRDWRQVHTPHTPPPSSRNAMSYDPAHKSVVLLGPGGGQTWLFDGTDWKQAFPGASPPFNASAGSGGALRWFPDLGRVVFVGGANSRGTWAWDGSNWRDLKPGNPGPSLFDGNAVGYSPGLKSLVAMNVIGPFAVWRFDGRDWTQLGAPAPGINVGMSPLVAHDDSRDAWLVLPGQYGPSPPSGMWIERSGSWSASPLAPTPSRTNAIVAYDPVGRRVLVFGGVGDGRFLADLWAWDGARWSRLS